MATHDDYYISTNQQELNVPYIHDYLCNRSYWAKGIPIDIVQRSIEGSLCFGVYDRSGKQAGFARVITDKATFGYLADVFIDEGHRGKGLAKWLVAEILKHPDLKGLRRIMLGTRDAHELYRKYGFTEIPNNGRFMQISIPDIYFRDN